MQMTKKNVLIVEGEHIEAIDLQLIVEKAGYTVTGIAHSVHQALELAEKRQPHLALVDIKLQGVKTGIDLGRMLGLLNIPFIFLSTNCNPDTLEAAKRTQPYGCLFKPYRAKELLIAMALAEYRHEHHIEGLIRQQSLISDQLSAIAAADMDLPERLLAVGKIIQAYLPFDYLGYEWYGGNEGESGRCGYQRVGLNEYARIAMKGLRECSGTDIGSGVGQGPATMREPVSGNISTGELTRRISSVQADIINTLMMESLLLIPLDAGNGTHFSMYLASRPADTHKEKHRELASRLQAGLKEGIRRILGVNRCSSPGSIHARSGAAAETAGAFEGIVGNSPLLLRLFEEIRQVAPMDSTVLILGESGTGKEKIAQSIHRLSDRKTGPFVRVNCAGFPPSLIESELFGHEKGAFTGAMERRLGKFEQANNGTIFLDEVGEMPLESQVKLLRVLQEREIERIGSQTTTSIDIRIIAATNRNLWQEVAAGRFRQDLYYRLNVFPIELPPLRDRAGDICKLTRHFIARFGQRTGKKVRDIHPTALLQLEKYSWPGNIRELEHVLERSLVLCKEEVLEMVMLPPEGCSEISTPRSEERSKIKSLKEMEKEYLIAVLKSCNGRLSGKKGAASILGIPSSTLYSKLIKLGIKSPGE